MLPPERFLLDLGFFHAKEGVDDVQGMNAPT